MNFRQRGDRFAKTDGAGRAAVRVAFEGPAHETPQADCQGQAERNCEREPKPGTEGGRDRASDGGDGGQKPQGAVDDVAQFVRHDCVLLQGGQTR